MTILVTQKSFPTGYDPGWHIYYLKEALKAAGWTVVGSSNGTSGGMDGIDRMLSGAAFNNNNTTWVVVQSPHANAADRIQLLMYPSAGTPASTNSSNYLTTAYNPNADYVGSSSALPTSAYSTAATLNVYSSWYGYPSSTYRYTLVVDNAPPYGFWCLSNCIYSAFMLCTFQALIPLENAPTASNPGKPYIYHTSWNNDTGSSQVYIGYPASLNANSYGSTLGEVQGRPRAPQPVWGVSLGYYGTSAAIPYNVNVLADNTAQQFPIVWDCYEGYKGTSSFMQWIGGVNSMALCNFDLLSDETGVNKRFVLGHVSLPWDGTTIPMP